MKRMLLSLFLLSLLFAACGPAPDISAVTPPYLDTGIDPEAWAQVPAGEFPYGQHDHMTMVEAYEIMITDVTNEQYGRFLNEALATGVIRIGDVEVVAGETVQVLYGAAGYYPGDPFDGYEHEEEITAGDKLYIPLAEAGLRLRFDAEGVSVSPRRASAGEAM